MLSYMRRNAGSWMIKVLLVGVSLSFVIGFGILPTLRDKQGLGVIVAEVGDRRITRGEWNAAYQELLRAYRETYQDRFSEEMAKQLHLREAALDNLINRVLQMQEARRLGLEVTDEELRGRLRSLPYFQRNGHFSKDLYMRLLQANHLTPAEFEARQREEMLVEAFRDFVQGSVKVSEEELWNRYLLEHEQVDLDALLVRARDLEKAVEVDEASLKEYFGRNSERFMTPERVDVTYLRFDPAAYRDEVKVYTGDIEEYYEAHLEDYTSPEESHLRHILLRIPPGADATVREKKRKVLEALAERARNGEDFALLAKTYSEDASAKDGGDLGYVKRGELLPDVEKVAFSLKPGEISDIVTTPRGLLLLKVEDYRAASVTPLEKVKEKIRKVLTDEKAWHLARRKAEEASWEIKDKGAFPAAGSSVAGIEVKETGYFGRGEKVPGLEEGRAFKDAAFALAAGETSEVIRGEKGYYLLHGIGRKQPEVPPFEAVKDRVEASFRRERSVPLAEQRARELLGQARAGADLRELGQREEVRLVRTGFFSRLQGYVPKVGRSEEMIKAAFRLTPEAPWPEKVFSVNGSYVVIHLRGRKEADRGAFEAEKEKLRERIIAQKSVEVYRRWLAFLRSERGVKISPDALPDRAA